MADAKRYTAEQLAQLAGVSLRTVRYYVQEELIDRPLARGPGAHFTDAHLGQLKRCKLLQDWGFDLETIRDRSSSFQGILEGFTIDSDYMRDGAMIREVFKAMGGEPGDRLTAKQAEALRAAVQKLRGKRTQPVVEKKAAKEVIPMADGIDLVIDRSAYDIPSPKALVDIALQVRKAFDPMRKRDDEDD
jgi:DNA-binding transcriptional MerR regulator